MPNRSKESTPGVRAGVYTRISWDPAGQGAGVGRQRADCMALCADRGWEIAQYFEDKDASAYSGKPRRAYERMLSAIEGRVPWTPSSPGTTTGSTVRRESSRPSLT